MRFKIVIPLLALAALAAQAPAPTDGAKILAVYAFPAESHFGMHRTLIRELIKHGHEVTMVTAYTFEPLKLGSNFTEILIEPMFDNWAFMHERLGGASLFDIENDPLPFLKTMYDVGIASSEHALKIPKVQALINVKKTEGVYDLLLVEQFIQEAFLALAHVYNIPVVSSATFTQQLYMSQMFGLVTPWSYVPHVQLPLNDRMSFWERAYNSYFALRDDLEREFKFFPKMDALVQKYFGHLPIQFPSVSAMEKNNSAILINKHTPLSAAIPTMENMVNVGGLHIYPPKPLPADLQKFLDEPEHGVIYFSLGTQVQSKDMPLEKLQLFLDVFRQLKQRVLWKFENDSIPNLPNNVMIRKWLPQNDILAHPNVRVFISHGGLFGSQEAVYHAVPVLGMPFFFDQMINLKTAESSGYAIRLDFKTLTRDALEQGLNELLYNPTYRNNVKRMSSIFRDRTMGPRETALHWIDYVIRHKGARHLRATGLDLKWYEFYLLDVVALAVAVLVTAFGASFWSVRWILRNLKGEKNKHKVQ